MSDSKLSELKKHIDNVKQSCSGTDWEEKTISELRSTLRKSLGLRDSLLDTLLS